MLVETLHALGLQSVYHGTEGVAHGDGTTKTYFHAKKLHFGYHIDYAFLSGAPGSLAIGHHEDWLMYSDHMPLVLDIAEP